MTAYYKHHQLRLPGLPDNRPRNLNLIVGDCRQALQSLPDQSVNCVVTSPPYFGLRDYGVDGQIGLEQTPAEFVAKLVEVFSEVHRVLRDDGTLWLNLGDTYAADRGGTTPPAQTVAGGVNGKGGEKERRGQAEGYNPTRDCRRYGLKHKDLIGIPWRVAFALQEAGWYLRQDIIWHKPNPMPESVRDRCTKAHEYLFLLTKSPKYYFDSEAIKEPAKWERWGNQTEKKSHSGTAKHLGGKTLSELPIRDKKNKRSVWSVPTGGGFKGAHFATFPPDLIEPCILAGCPEGGVVLDPFGGSGTTAGVALAHNRRAIICELNPEYAAMVPARVEEIRRRVGVRHP